MAQSLESLPLEERILRYLQFADAAYIKAGEAEMADAQADFLCVAASWQALADETQRLAGCLSLMRLALESDEDDDDLNFGDE